MNEQLLAQAGSFCWNQKCADYAKIGVGNLRKFGQTKKGTPRFQCRTCGKTFTELRGTVFHKKHHSLETIVECLALLADRCSLAAIHRIKGIKEETVLEWLEQASRQVAPIEELLLGEFKFSRVQLDALWAYVGHRGEKGAMVRKSSVVLSGGGPP